MKSLREQFELLMDVSKQEETAYYQYFNLNNQAIILNFITEEIANNTDFYTNEQLLQSIESRVKISKNVSMLMELYKWMRDIRENSKRASDRVDHSANFSD